MADRAVVEAVCRMASDFYRLGNQSMLDLLKSSGYLQEHDAITEQDLADFLRSDPNLIDAWVLESENKRTNCGYYVLPPDVSPNRSSDWVVGNYPGGKDEHFPDGPTACARFVKFEAENLRYMIEGGPPFKTGP